MKKVVLLLLSVFSLIGNAQSNKKKTKAKEQPPKEVVETIPQVVEPKPAYELSQEDKDRLKHSKTILISSNVFVQLVFKSAVQVVRSGAPDMALVRNEDNVVTIQALQEGVNSNISVKTADGLYYSYRIISEDNQEIPLFYEVSISEAVNGQTKLIEDEKKKIVEKMSVQEVAQTIYGYEGYIKNRNTANYRNIHIQINGVYIDKGKLFFLLKLENKSNLNYKIETLQFATVPLQKTKKRVESEEREYKPLFFYKPLTEIKAKSQEIVVAVFDQFTLNDQKKLEIRMNEESGERAVRLDIDSKKIVEAKNIQ